MSLIPWFGKPEIATVWSAFWNFALCLIMFPVITSAVLLISVTVIEVLLLTCVTVVVSPLGNKSLSPTTSSDKNLDAEPVMVSALDVSVSDVTLALPVKKKLSSKTTSAPNTAWSPVPLSWCNLLISPESYILSELVVFVLLLSLNTCTVSFAWNVPTTLCNNIVEELLESVAVIPVAPEDCPFTFIPWTNPEPKLPDAPSLVNIVISNRYTSSSVESALPSYALTLAKPICCPPPVPLPEEPNAVS